MPFGRVQQASALIPLAVLSIAWTASLASAGSGAAADGSGTLPDGSHVPAQAIRAPASLSTPGKLAPGIHGNVTDAVSTASANGIPAVALAAYQRAQTVINAADTTCHMPWELVAAIGRVESDHGRTNGNHLTNKGIAEPGIFGPALDGRHGTTLIRDTDAGQYDRDTTYDRAVGPMQFIPSTWAIVGVDGDNDGQRNPQDIYDAALSSAVYLCSGPDDLSTTAGQQASVFRYNHSHRYVALVLAIMHAYMSGDYTSVPNGTTTTGFTFGSPPSHGTQHVQHTGHHHNHTGHHNNPTTGPTSNPTTHVTHTAGPTTGPTTAATTGSTANPTSNPTQLPTTLPTSLPITLPTTLPTSLPTLLTYVQAVAQCTAEGYVDNPLVSDDPFDQCVYNLTH